MCVRPTQNQQVSFKLQSGCKSNGEFHIIKGIYIAVNIESRVRAVGLDFPGVFSSHVSPNGYTSGSVKSVNVKEQSVLPRKKGMI